MTTQDTINKTHKGDATPKTDDLALLKRPQLAQAINVSCRTIDNWQRQKRIPFLKLSPRCVRYSLQRVLEALRKFEVKEAGR